MKKLAFVVFGIFLGMVPACAQFFEFGIGGGTSHYMGDLAPVMVQMSQTKVSQKLFANYIWKNKIGLGISLNHGKISGDDTKTDNIFLKQRNLNFKTGIWEGHFRVENYIKGFYPFQKTKKLFPYVFAGLGMFLYSPYTTYNGARVALQPLGTEGQGTPLSNKPKYNLAQVCIPFGAGVKYPISKHFILGAEVGFRKLFTDYLDDVSGNYVDLNMLTNYSGAQAAALSVRADELTGNPAGIQPGEKRGNPKQLDWYTFVQVSLSYIPFNNKNRLTYMKSTGKVDCFSF
jgi:hypothetical protein